MQQATASDFAITGLMQQQGMAYGLMQQHQQTIPGDLNTAPYGRTSMYSDQIFNQAAYGSYGLGQHGFAMAGTESDSAPGSMAPLRYPSDHLVGHFHAQQAYGTWVHDDSHNQFQPVVRLSSSVPPAGFINSSFPDGVQGREAAIEGFQDGQWPPKREPIREYVGQPLSYRGLGAPSRPEGLQQVWRPGLSDTVRNMVSPFKGIPGVLAPQKRVPMKTSKQKGSTGGVQGPGWCSVCQIDCTTKEILEQHKSGKKHTKRLQRQQLQGTVAGQALHTNQVKYLEKGPGGKQNLQGKAQSAVCESNLGKREQDDKGTVDDIARKRQKLLDVGTAIQSVKVCSLCNVVCNSQIVFDSHLSGRKHVARLTKADEVANPGIVAKKSAAGAEVGDKQDVSAD